MTEKTKDSGAIDPNGSANDPSASGNENQDNLTDTVAYDTYKRTLGEAKKAKSELSDMRAKLEQYENAKLEAEGKKDEIIEKQRKQIDELFGKLKTTEASFAEMQITSQVADKAKELGCIDTDMLMKIIDGKGLDIVDGYKVSTQSLEMVLNEIKESKPYLFSKPAPKIHDGAPTTMSKDNDGGSRVTSKMTKDELIERAKEIDRLEGKTKNLAW